MTEIIEGTAVEVSNVPVQPHPDWAGDLPVFLVFEPADGEGGNVGIDLDVAGWIEGNRETFRRPGIWFLMNKAGVPLLFLPTSPGDQFFYHRHHVGVIGSGGTASVVAHVIGRKPDEGPTIRLWLLPNGMVTTGEEAEVDPIAGRLIG